MFRQSHRLANSSPSYLQPALCRTQFVTIGAAFIPPPETPELAERVSQIDTNNKAPIAEACIYWGFKMVEAAGVEPASEKADNREPSCFSQF
jgi:hypothetical protein